jgi:hypothetical protein
VFDDVQILQLQLNSWNKLLLKNGTIFPKMLCEGFVACHDAAQHLCRQEETTLDINIRIDTNYPSCQTFDSFMKCSDRNQLENISSFIDFVALLIELHIWRNDIKYSSFQDASIDIKISPFEWSLELHIKSAFSFELISTSLF